MSSDKNDGKMNTTSHKAARAVKAKKAKKDTREFGLAPAHEDKYKLLNTSERLYLLAILKAGGHPVSVPDGDNDPAIQVLKKIGAINGTKGHYTLDPSAYIYGEIAKKF